MKAAIHGHLKQLFLADEIRCGMSLNTQTKGRASVLPRSPWAGRGHSVCEGRRPDWAPEAQCKQGKSFCPLRSDPRRCSWPQTPPIPGSPPRL